LRGVGLDLMSFHKVVEMKKNITPDIVVYVFPELEIINIDNLKEASS